jgi:hypothetical protein
VFLLPMEQLLAVPVKRICHDKPVCIVNAFIKRSLEQIRNVQISLFRIVNSYFTAVLR